VSDEQTVEIEVPMQARIKRCCGVEHYRGTSGDEFAVIVEVKVGNEWRWLCDLFARKGGEVRFASWGNPFRSQLSLETGGPKQPGWCEMQLIPMVKAAIGRMG